MKVAVVIALLTLLRYLSPEIASEDESSVPPCSHLNNESSVPEELGSDTAENCPSKISEDQEQLESLDHKPTEEMVYKHVSGFVYHCTKTMLHRD